MNSLCKTLEQVTKERKEKALKTLEGKAKEYAFKNRYDNFQQAATFTREEPSRMVLCFAFKHAVSVLDIIEDRLDKSFIDEKFGDLFNYLILFIGLKKRSQNLTKIIESIKPIIRCVSPQEYTDLLKLLWTMDDIQIATVLIDVILNFEWKLTRYDQQIETF